MASSSGLPDSAGMSRQATPGGVPVAGGFDGTRVYLSDRAADPLGTLAHELGHAIAGDHLDPESSSRSQPAVVVRPVNERAAEDAGRRLSMLVGNSGLASLVAVVRRQPLDIVPTVRFPKLTDSSEAIGRLKIDAYYRYRPQDLKDIELAIAEEDKNNRSITLVDLVEELLSGEKTKRTGYLLSLLLSRHGIGGIAEAQSWAGVQELFSFIRSSEYASGRKGSSQGGFRKELSKLAKRSRAQEWHAATVAAVRAGLLDIKSFTELSRALLKVAPGESGEKGKESKQEIGESEQEGASITLEITPDLYHEFALQDSGKPKGKVRLGSADLPKYGKGQSVAELNSKIRFFESSGYYQEDPSGLLLKQLDMGHTIVDMYENKKDRNETTVDPETDFRYQALLSPGTDQKVVGANGNVLGDGYYMFVVDESLRIRYLPAVNFVGEGGSSKSYFQFIPHSQLAERKAVPAAGNFRITGGKFAWIDNGSGHYRVDADVNKRNVEIVLNNLGYQIDKLTFKDRAKGENAEEYERVNAIIETLQGSARPSMTPEMRDIERAMKFMRKEVS